MSVLLSALLTLRTWAHSRAALQLEVLALCHQLQVLQRTRPRRLRLNDGPLALGRAFARVDRMARGTRHRQARNTPSRLVGSPERKELWPRLIRTKRAMKAVATFAYGITFKVRELQRNQDDSDPNARASGCFWTPKKNPHEMGSKKGNVTRRRKMRCSQVIENIGSSGRIRTYNPPVNGVTQVVGLAGSSCR